MSSIEIRLAALEKMVADLKTENELLKMLTPLEAVTEGLKAASPAEVAGWVEACAAAGVSKKKAPKEEKKNTNPTGPAEFNAFIQAIWHERAAAAGVVGNHDDAFKKASKEVGVTFQKAREEASRRKAEMEGKPAPVPKVKAAKPKAPKAAKAPAAAASSPVVVPAPAASSPVVAPVAVAAKDVKPLEKPTADDIFAATPEYDDEMRAKMKAECEGYGWEACVFGGNACWLDPASGDVYSYDGESNAGVYDAESGEFCPA